MNKKDICDIGIKVIGLWMLSTAALLASFAFATITAAGDPHPLWVLMTQLILLLAIALCMLKWSSAMATIACGSSVAHANPRQDLRHVFFSLVGVLMLLSVVGRFSNTVIAFQWERKFAEHGEFDPWTNVVDMAARLALGIFLVLGSGILARLLTKPSANKEAAPRTD